MSEICHPVFVTVQLTNEDISVVRRIRDYQTKHNGCPKKHEIVGYGTSHEDLTMRAMFKAFDRLKVLGIVEHRPSGLCRLTEQGRNLPL